MKIVSIITLTLLSLCVGAAQPAFGAGSATLNKVVIDAGHGGDDSGAQYGHVDEKAITLAIALKLGALIEQNYPDVKVIYTRKTDVAVDVRERGNIANKAGGNLFISIHANSTKVGNASGSETYVMGLDKTGKNLDVAMRENDVIVYEKDYSSKYQGYEPGSPESFIMFNMMQYSYLEQSLSLASLIEQQYKVMRTVPSRGVKQGPFLVLWTPAMPSLLTEVGFINNPSDLKVLTSPVGQENIARAIFNAFSAYKTRIDGKGKLIVLGSKSYADASTPAPSASAAQPATATQDTPIDESRIVTFKKSTPSSTIVAKPVAATDVSPTPANGQGIVFAVQVRASVNRLSREDDLFRSFASEVYEYKEDNYYRYYVGRYNTYDEAQTRLAEARRVVADAFVVALRDGRKIPVADARRLTEK